MIIDDEEVRMGGSTSRPGVKQKGKQKTKEKLTTTSKSTKKWSRWCLALICKEMKELASPLLYAHCEISSLSTLQKFTNLLHDSDQKWDSLRRIPYSTPGRWVQSLKLSDLAMTTTADTYAVDALLSTLFPLCPFLMHLELSLTLQLSRRAFAALALRDGAQNLRVLIGVRYDAASAGSGSWEDPLAELVSCCSGLEELDVVGTGPENINTLLDAVSNSAAASSLPPPPPSSTLSARPLHLPHLRMLTLLATPTSPLLLRLTNSPLPSLRTLTITPYTDLLPPLSLVHSFLLAHGPQITQLVLHTPNFWPTVRFPPPKALLKMLPNLRALSLEEPSLEGGVFGFDVPEQESSMVACTAHHSKKNTNGLLDINLESECECGAHPLTTLWIPRPQPAGGNSMHPSDARTALVRLVARLPHLRVVRAQGVRWASRSLSARAREAGFQGELYALRRLLKPFGVRVEDEIGLEEAA